MPQSVPQSAIFKGFNISTHFGDKILLDNVSFDIKVGEVVGVVGRNGSGKSTLLKLIAGQTQLDSGVLEHSPKLALSYIPQNIAWENNLTGLEYLAKSWFEFNKKFKSENLEFVLDISHLDQPWKHLDKEKHIFLFESIIEAAKCFDCSDLNTDLVALSGGEKRKLALATFLLNKPELLILDEPTNHLDIPTIQSLEQNLKKLAGGVILVSHDRFFLDNVTTRMLEIQDAKLFSHKGNYQKFLEDKALRLEIESTQEQNRQAYLKRELGWVRAGVQGRGTKDKGRLQRFYDLKNQKSPIGETKLDLLLPDIIPLGNKILNFENVEINLQNTLETKKIIKNLNFVFQPQTRLGLVGANGSGKTTLIKAILNQIPVENGKIVVGQNTCFNYQDQEKLSLNLEHSPLEELSDGQETMNFGSKTISTRKYLEKLLFSRTQMMSKIKHFSGGEKARLLLAKILKQGGNFLILDEPTNDLDLETIRLLEESLVQFEGVSIIVSHDRYFLDRVCTHILALEGNGDFSLISGNYSEYLGKQKEKRKLLDQNLGINVAQKSASSKEILKNNSKQIREKEKEIKKLESQIDKLEKEMKILEVEFANQEFYSPKSDKEILKNKQKTQKYTELIENHKKMMESWEKLSS